MSQLLETLDVEDIEDEDMEDEDIEDDDMENEEVEDVEEDGGDAANYNDGQLESTEENRVRCRQRFAAMISAIKKHAESYTARQYWEVGVLRPLSFASFGVFREKSEDEILDTVLGYIPRETQEVLGMEEISIWDLYKMKRWDMGSLNWGSYLWMAVRKLAGTTPLYPKTVCRRPSDGPAMRSGRMGGQARLGRVLHSGFTAITDTRAGAREPTSPANWQYTTSPDATTYNACGLLWSPSHGSHT